jgi:crossover junction endodeoxyribonuclease RusA
VVGVTRIPVSSAAVEFEVRGLPVAQGSARAFIANGRPIIATEGNRSRSPLGAWRTAIAQAASDAVAGPPWDGPVSVYLSFRPASRPASHYLPANARRPVRELRLDSPFHHAGKPDADKLARAALDALTGVVFEDDRQVASLDVLKRWPADGEGPGVTIRIARLGVTR